MSTKGSHEPRHGEQQQPSQRRVVSGDKLTADLSKHDPGTTEEFAYWVGVTPACPFGGLDIAGVNFPKMTEDLVKSPQRTGRFDRHKKIGEIVRLTPEKLQILQERLPNTVLRFRDANPGNEPGPGSTLKDLEFKPRTAEKVTIPTEKQIKESEARGRGVPKYVRRMHDEPATNYIFALLCEDQANPQTGSSYPDVLSTTGLNLPELV